MSSDIDPFGRHRTRAELEHDVLAGLLLHRQHHTAMRRKLNARRFSTHEHRDAYRAIMALPSEEATDEAIAEVARALGWGVQRATDWAMAASPWDYEHDVARLCRLK